MIPWGNSKQRASCVDLSWSVDFFPWPESKKFQVTEGNLLNRRSTTYAPFGLAKLRKSFYDSRVKRHRVYNDSFVFFVKFLGDKKFVMQRNIVLYIESDLKKSIEFDKLENVCQKSLIYIFSL